MSNVEPYRDGQSIWVPKRAEGDGVIGVGWVQLRLGDRDYAMWDTYLRGGAKRTPLWKISGNKVERRSRG